MKPTSVYTCRVCKADKPAESWVSGNWCRDCRNAYHRKWGEKNPGYTARYAKEKAQARKAEELRDIEAKFGSVDKYLEIRHEEQKFKYRERWKKFRHDNPGYIREKKLRDREKHKQRLTQDPEFRARINARESARYWGKKKDGHTRVYFMRSGPAGPIKIGYSTSILSYRRKQLQNGNPEEIIILGEILDATVKDEKALHRRFAHLRIRYEWFAASEELLEYIRLNATQEATGGEQEAIGTAVPQATA